MKQFRYFENCLYTALELAEEDRFWNGAIVDLKKMIKKIEDPQIKRDFFFQLEVLIHQSQKKLPESSKITSVIRNILNEIPIEFVEISAKIREELVIPPTNFDFLTRQTLTEQVYI